MIATQTALALTGLILWPLTLGVVIILQRAWLVFITRERRINSFAPSGEDVSAFAVRLSRAHANCCEFLPFVLALLLFAIAGGQTSVTEPFALVMLGSRIAQSIVHVMSTSPVAVFVRFVFFVPQVLLSFFWAIRLVVA